MPSPYNPIKTTWTASALATVTARDYADSASQSDWTVVIGPSRVWDGCRFEPAPRALRRVWRLLAAPQSLRRHRCGRGPRRLPERAERHRPRGVPAAPDTMIAHLVLALAAAAAHASGAAVCAPRSAPLARSRLPLRRSSGAARMEAEAAVAEGGPAKWFVAGQHVGPQAPGQPSDKPYSNMIKLNPVEAVKLNSGPPGSQLLSPLKEELPVRAARRATFATRARSVRRARHVAAAGSAARRRAARCERPRRARRLRRRRSSSALTPRRLRAPSRLLCPAVPSRASHAALCSPPAPVPRPPFRPARPPRLPSPSALPSPVPD